MLRNYFLYSLVGLIFAGFVFSKIKGSGPKAKSPQLAEAVVGPDGSVTVGAVRLWKEYQENEVAADAKYKGKQVQVTGTLMSIERDVDGAPVLHLVSGNPIFLTMATLDKVFLPEAARLKKGEVVAVRCTGAGQMMRMPQLEKCTLLKTA
jgi:hypothetical protein